MDGYGERSCKSIDSYRWHSAGVSEPKELLFAVSAYFRPKELLTVVFLDFQGNTYFLRCL